MLPAATAFCWLAHVNCCAFHVNRGHAFADFSGAEVRRCKTEAISKC